MKEIKLPLPIDRFIPDILKALKDHSVLMVKASPGSGKTTRLPWAIACSSSERVIVLEPRRLAAKLAATRIAAEEELTLGVEVGYHFRFEKKASDSGRVTFYTEGTFLRKFLSNPDLFQSTVIILDEFHERHLETDLAAALLRSELKNKNIKIILMSATLDVRLKDYFEDAAMIEIEAPNFPVQIQFLPNQPSVLNQGLEAKIKKAVESTVGDTLVFLPGMREMLRTKALLEGNFDVFLLHADLSKEEQSLALEESHRRKIVLATNIAESSLTIPGITVVIDSGLQREAHYSPWNGLKFIQDTPVTKSSAIQRTGRAGRTAPGICIRLYSEQDFNQRKEFTVPEIKRADLTNTCLLLADQKTPEWFDPPEPEKWKKALELLEKLGALREGKLTQIGAKMRTYPLDARLARILVEGEALSIKHKKLLLDYISEEIEGDKSGTLKRRLSTYLRTDGHGDFHWEKVVLSGFPDQVAKYRSQQRDFIHYSGKTLKAHQGLEDLTEGFYLILDITQRQEAVKVLELEENWLWELDPFPFTEEEQITVQEHINFRRKTKLGSIVMDETVLKPNWEELSPEHRSRIKDLSHQKVGEKINEFRSSRFYQKAFFWARRKNLDLEAFLEELDLEVFFQGQMTLGFEDFEGYLQNELEQEFELLNLEHLLPDKIALTGQRELIIHYPLGMDPYLEAPIQDFYGLKETPAILDNEVPLTLKLLGPHRRPIQVTKDLKNFWQKTYQELKKEYQRDYPRHYWPEHPSEARPFLLKSHLPKT